MTEARLTYLPDNLWDMVHCHGNSFHGGSSFRKLMMQKLTA